MIRYALSCDAGHRFDSWFGDSAAFETLAARRLVSCPRCGSVRVGKAIMAPAVSRSAGKAAMMPAPGAPRESGAPDGAPDPFAAQRELRAMMRALREKAVAATQDVGDRFPAEARRMHEGEVPRRGIRGEATLDEARSLLEDGILILPLPGPADELN